MSTHAYGMITQPVLIVHVNSVLAFFKSNLLIPVTGRKKSAMSTEIRQPSVVPVYRRRGWCCPLRSERFGFSSWLSCFSCSNVYTGGRSMISVMPGYSSIVNNVFAKFLARLPPSRSDIVPPNIPIRERMRLALNKLSDITGLDTSSLDCMCSMSFSCVTEDVVQSQIALLKHYQNGADQAFTPDPQDNWRRSECSFYFDVFH